MLSARFASRQIIAFTVLAFILNAACSNAAQAAVITNLDSTPQQLEVAATDGHFQPVTIAAGETYRVPGQLVVRFHGREVHLDEDEEYAIWPNKATGGDFGPQMRETRGSGSLSH